MTKIKINNQGGKGVPRPSIRQYDHDKVTVHICTELQKGRSLADICSKDENMPTPAGFLKWVETEPEVSKHYAHAREIGYLKLADEIIALSDKTHEWVTIQELDPNGKPMFNEAGEPMLKKVLMPLNSDVVAHKRVQIDTRKWMLSKMLPKIYGDKLTQEHTGANGGPIAMAAVDLKNLSDEELENMNRLLTKAGRTT
jgi:hypothetical protein